VRALVCSRLDGLDGLALGCLPDPEPGPGEVLIEVAAAALNFPDLLMAEGRYQFRPALPFAPGMECAGRIAALGPGVDGLAVGQRVAAHPWQGCFAERAVAPAALTFPLPDGIDAVTAAAMPIGYGTVHHALIDRARLQAGESLLVLGAAGGVGLMAVELGRMLGATVLAAANGQAKLELARRYGAAHGIDYTCEPLAERVKTLTGGRGADVAFDPVGGDFTRQAMRALGWGGRLLVIGFAAGEIPRLPANHVLIKGLEVIGSAYQKFCLDEPGRARAAMAELFGWWQAGRLRPHVSATAPLDGAVELLRAMAGRRATGRLVVTL